MRVARWLWVLLLPLALMVAWGWWRGTVDVRAARAQLDEISARRQQLEQSNRAVEREVEALRREREARARAAREALDVAAPDEVLVVIPSATPRAVAQ